MNSHNVTVKDTGSASAKSGLSVAAPPPANAATQAPVARAASGNAQATGVQASNAVSNSALVGVTVAGTNTGTVTAQTQSQVNVTDQSNANASTGATTSNPTGATDLVVTPPPTVPSAAVAPTSASQTSVGLATAVSMQGSGSAVGATPVPGASPTAVLLQDVHHVTITNAGAGLASSAPTCAGSACPSATPSPAPTGTPTGLAAVLDAASGGAQAVGLQAVNAVLTQANVNVNVQGQNQGTIEVLVSSITNILNVGNATASTGAANAIGAQGGSANGPSMTGAATSSQSGAAKATGADVSNFVSYQSDTNIHLEGDNTAPLDIVVDLSAQIINLGIASAQSGSSAIRFVADQAANGVASAASGAADALGLRVDNTVNLIANVKLDLEGSNFSLIRIIVRFTTNIENRGFASAASGAATTTSGSPGNGIGSSSAAQTNQNQPVGGSSSPSLANTGSHSAVAAAAHGGNATAQGAIVQTGVGSSQYAVANGMGQYPQVPPAVADTSALASLLQQSVWQMPDPTVDAARRVITHLAESGDTMAIGLISALGASNSQVAIAKEPGAQPVAKNFADFIHTTTSTSDAHSGLGRVGPPIPDPTPASRNEGQRSEGGHASTTEHGSTQVQVSVTVTPNTKKKIVRQPRGSYFDADPWAVDLPNSRPTLPGRLSKRTPLGGSNGEVQDQMHALPELPQISPATAPLQAPSTARRSGTTALPSQVAETLLEDAAGNDVAALEQDSTAITPDPAWFDGTPSAFVPMIQLGAESVSPRIELEPITNPWTPETATAALLGALAAAAMTLFATSARGRAWVSVASLRGATAFARLTLFLTRIIALFTLRLH